MTPGAICECGYTIATKKDTTDEEKMQQFTNRVAEHAVGATFDALNKATEVIDGKRLAKDVPSGLHGKWQYAEKTEGDKRFANPDELL